MIKRYWQSSKAGDIARLSLHEAAMSPLADNYIRVAVKSIGLNFADIFALSGLYSATPQGPFTPGLEYSGLVIESRSPDWQVGDRVMGVTRFGGYCSVIDIESPYLTKLPDDWSFDQGAAYPVQTLTAYYALKELGQIKPQHKVLVQSAAGGVGIQAMRLVEAFGALPVGSVRSTAKQTFLNEMGFDHVLVRKEDFRSQLNDANLRFDLVLDGVGGEVQKASFDALNPMGRLVVFGAAEFTPGKRRPNYLRAAWRYLQRPKYDVMDMISTNRSVMAFNLIWLYEHVEYLSGLIKDMSSINIEPPHVGHIFDFESAHEAIETLRQGNTVGKVVLSVQSCTEESS
ncbi:MAG: zinc-binding dehydrogenase [Gammaproteobacteria bacterium]|nr:zinc-binding dehydrogenase [Gammaproteobacteria bacterium]